MRKPLIVLLAIGILLAGCGGWGDSRVNPRNWFGKSRTVQAQVPVGTDAANPLIPGRSAFARRPDTTDNRVAIASLGELRVERTTTGAIVHVTGIATRQGAFNAALRPDPVDEDNPADVLSYTFVVAYPRDPTVVGTERTRTIHAAYSLSIQDLRGIRLIRIQSQQNTMETRRR